jgi:WhiB family redox-sensing transcriptional regulator
MLGMPRPDWQARARCRGYGPEAFFPEKGQPTTTAKRVCMACEVRTECLAFALALGSPEKFGVWGGLSERQRRMLRRTERAAS